MPRRTSPRDNGSPAPFTSLAPRLPPELTDMIIDHLWDHKLALRSCSLTCKGWLNASRHHLFNTLYIAHLLERPFAAFSDFLHKSPPVARHVRRLTLVGNDQEDFMMFFGRRDLRDRHQLTMRFMSSLLSSLPDLRSLTLRAVRLAGAFSVPLNPLKIEHLVVTDVGTLTDSVDGLLAFLGLFSEITCLELSSISTNLRGLSDVEREKRLRTIKIPVDLRVHSLRLSVVEPLAACLCEVFRRTLTMKTLTCIDVPWEVWEEVVAVGLVLKDAALQVQRVELNPLGPIMHRGWVGQPIAPGEWRVLNLHLCSNLTALVFQMEIEDDSEEPDLNLTLCNATLDILSRAPSSLRTVEFRFRIFGNGQELLRDPVNVNWPRLEQVLCGIDDLQEVVIKFKDGTNSTPDALMNCHVVVEENLPRIKAKNALRILYNP